jgi:hypothetical protein
MQQAKAKDHPLYLNGPHHQNENQEIFPNMEQSTSTINM